MIKDIFGENFAHDFNLMKGKNFKLTNMLNTKTLFKDYSEYNPKNYGSKDNFLIHTVAMKFSPRRGKVSGVKRIGNTNSDIVYINGMMTQENMAVYQQKYLSHMLHLDVELIYNYTGGLIVDLIECSIDRHNTEISEAVKSTVSIFREKINNFGKLTIIGHSQGGIIATAALRILEKELTKNQLKNIFYVTFGTGFKENIISPFIYSEHFANNRDPIVHLGLLHDDYHTEGQIYLRESIGHLLVADYLYPLQAGEFGYESRMYNKIREDV